MQKNKLHNSSIFVLIFVLIQSVLVAYFLLFVVL